MKMQLVNLLLLSDKRKNFLLLLEDGPKNIDEILDLLKMSRISLLPQIKILKEEGLILQQGDLYELSIIGNILIKKARPLLDAASTFEENDFFWGQRKLDSIPFHLLKRIGDLKGSQLLEPGLAHGFDLFPQIINHFAGSSQVMLLFSYFHPQIPSFSLELAKKNAELRLILSKDSFNRFSGDFRDMGEKILETKNASIFVHAGTPFEIPALIAVSENALLLGFFNKKGRFEGQYLLNLEPCALAWGRELFEYYMEKSENIRAIHWPESGSDNRKDCDELK